MMRWSDELRLIKFGEAAMNENGFHERTETGSTTVFANKRSVASSEFYRAAQAGYKAEYKFDIRSLEYSGEEEAEYPVGSGKQFRILRTYESKNGETIELTLVSMPTASEV